MQRWIVCQYPGALEKELLADEKEKAEFIHKHMNRKKLSNMLDVEMFESFVAFYDKNIKK